MQAITPAEGGGEMVAGAADLSALMVRYCDPAKAWAAARIGPEAFDTLVAQHGAATSPRLAPTPEERASLADDVEDQDWTDERRGNVYAELNQRINLDARRTKQAQDAAQKSEASQLTLREQKGIVARYDTTSQERKVEGLDVERRSFWPAMAPWQMAVLAITLAASLAATVYYSVHWPKQTAASARLRSTGSCRKTGTCIPTPSSTDADRQSRRPCAGMSPGRPILVGNIIKL